MSESEQDQAVAPRFSKAMIGRILAVGFFVILGTFAVIQSMRGSAPNAVNATVSLTPPAEDTENTTTDGLAGVGTEKVKTAFDDTAQQLSTSLDRKSTANAKATGFEPKKFTPPTGSLNNNPAKRPDTNAFARPSNSPPANSFNSAKTFTPPGNKKPFDNVPVVTSKPIAKPPARYAQADTGVPIIGNNSGFGSLQKTPQTKQPNLPTNSFGTNSTRNTFGSAAKKTAGAAAGLKSNTTNAADDLLQSVGKQGNAAANSIKQGVGGGFGPALPKTADAFGGRPTTPSASPLEAAQPKSGFGGRPLTSFKTEQKTPSNTAAKQEDTGFGGRGNLQTVRPITSQISDNAQKTPPKKSSPFGESNGFSGLQAEKSATQNPNLPMAQRSNPPMTQQSNVPVQPISTNLSTVRRNSSVQSNPTNPIGNDNFGGSLRPPQNTNSRLGAGNPGFSSNSGSLTKNVPGDRQLEGVQAPALTVEKLSPREIQVNQTANFEIVVKNVGRATAEDIHVFDVVPGGTQFEGSTPEPSKISQNQNIQWDLGQLRPGQEKRIKLRLKPIKPGEIGSVAQVTFAAQASMRTLVTKPVLEIVHQTNPTHLIGDDVMLDVVVTNKGDGAAKNVMIQQDVPTQLEFPDGLPGGSRGIEYEIGTLMPGKSRRVRLALKAADVGKIQNVMFASADGGLSAKHVLPIEVVSPKLVARSQGPTRRFLKRSVTHQFSVANKGTANATNVELIARLPSGLRYVQSNNQGRYDANTHAVYWSLAELARDVEAKVELKTMPVDVGNQPIKFETSADLKLQSDTEQTLSVEHLVDVFFDIDDVVDPIEIGSDTSYRLRVVNQGTKAASNVQLDVSFPTGLQPTSVEGSLRHNIRGQQITFEPINSMNPGDEISIVIHGKGQSAGDHRVTVNMRTDGRTTPVSKQESTRVYSDN